MTDVIVVGGGLIGMLTARELALAGASVTLFERDETGRESSWAGGGILSPLHPWRYPDPVTVLARWGQAHWESLAGALHAETGIDPEWTGSGLLVLEPDEPERAARWAERFGYVLEPVALATACEPAIAGAHAGLWMPDVAQVRNPRLVRALRRSLDLNGVQVEERRAVQGLRLRGGVVRGVETANGPVESKTVIVAAGAWSAGLLGEAAALLPVEPVRGQMLLFKAAPGVLSRIVLHGDRYVIPRRDGRILIGSTLERVGFDKATTASAAAELRERACALVPALTDYPVEHHWAGLRPGSPTGVPFIGEHPHIGGLFLNTGHFRNGVVLGPASARLAADLLLGRTPVVEPEPYRLGRSPAA